MPSLNYTIKQHKITRVGDTRAHIFLQCDNCGSTWSPNIQTGGRLPKGYWRCPNRCNYEEKEYKHSPEVRAYFAERNRKQREKSEK
jgi:hypothetical protein